MTRHRLALQRARVIPPDVEIGVLMRRTTAAGSSVTRGSDEVAAGVKPVTITKVADPANPVIGTNITWTVTVANTGTADAHSVVVTDALPAGYTFVSSNPSVGTYVDDVWTVGDLLIGATETLEIIATVNGTGPYTNTAGADYAIDGAPREETTGDIGAEAAPTLPAGSDLWYDSPNNSVIPFQAMTDAVSIVTPAGEFDVDDDADFEGDLPGLGVTPPVASAWWQLTTPADSAALLTVDTWLTTRGRVHYSGSGDPDYPGDTGLSIWTTAEAPPLGPLPTGSTDFESLVLVDQTDDSPDPGDSTRQYTSKLENVPLSPNKVYWIRVDTYDQGGMFFDGIDYRIRVSLTPVAPPAPVYLDLFDGSGALDGRTPDFGSAYVAPTGDASDLTTAPLDGSGGLTATHDAARPGEFTIAASALTADPGGTYDLVLKCRVDAHSGGYGSTRWRLNAASDSSQTWSVFIDIAADNSGSPEWKVAGLVANAGGSSIYNTGFNDTFPLTEGVEVELKASVTPSGVVFSFNGSTFGSTALLPGLAPTHAIVWSFSDTDPSTVASMTSARIGPPE